jgi:gamma-glutamyl:cysteine ligase YbdK (ATP-grasp superfamily)
VSAATEALRRSIALAKCELPHEGKSGRPGPYICATVELRVADMEAVLADNASLAARVKVLEAALLAYGEHTGQCRRQSAYSANCVCGLSAALVAKVGP